MCMQITVATTNVHKVHELQQLVEPMAWSVAALPSGLPDCEENGATFEANAMEKAAHYAQFVDGWVLADDSGISVPFLGGAPGVRSARYAGEHGNNEANNRKLLSELQSAVGEQRAASFVCVLALYHRRFGVGLVARGEVSGLVASSLSGQGGFGYDPLFYLPEHTCTMAELASSQKNQYSHRARAIQNLFDLWRVREDAIVSRQ